MPLTEEEELELLELEEEEAKAALNKQQAQTPPTPKGQQKPAPSFERRVQSDADRLAVESLESQKRDPGALNKVLSPVRQFTGTVSAHLNQSLPYRMLGKGVEKVAGLAPEPVKKTALGAAQKLGGAYSKLPEPVKNTAGILGDVASVVPGLDAGAMLGGKAISTGAKVASKELEEAGKSVLGGQLKIKKSLADRGYGARTDIKKANIINNISKYNLESATGDFSKMADNASKMATERIKQADDILMGIATDPNAPKGQFVDDIISDAMSNIDDIAAVGKEGQATKIFEDIIVGAYDRGLAATEPQGIEAIIEFKRKLDPDGKLFTSGPAVNDADNLDRAIRKTLYRAAVNKIREISPDAAELNKQAKELIDISNVAGDAASRTANPNKVFSLSNMMLGGAGLTTAGVLGSPATAAGTIAALGAKKYAEQGRGPALMIKAGKGLKKAQKLGETDVGGLMKRTLSNERGAAGFENPQIHTENFKKWFGDWKNKPEEASKVVDEKGKPLVVYHSTDKKFNEFDFNRLGKRYDRDTEPEAKALSELGVWHSDSKMVGKNNNPYSKEMVNYLDVKNPYRAGTLDDLWEETGNYDDGIDFRNELIDQGYDGIVLKDTEFGGESWVVFSPNQIKSATGNSGAFSKSTNDIRGSSALKTMGATALGAGAGLYGYEKLKEKQRK